MRPPRRGDLVGLKLACSTALHRSYFTYLVFYYRRREKDDEAKKSRMMCEACYDRVALSVASPVLEEKNISEQNQALFRPRVRYCTAHVEIKR